MQSSPHEASQEAGADDLSLEELLEQKLIWSQAADTEHETEELLSSAT